MPLTIIRNDITKLRVDAIVNAANTGLQMGGGVCGVIFSVAGANELQNACNSLTPIKTGEAVITPGSSYLPSISSIQRDLFIGTASKAKMLCCACAT